MAARILVVDDSRTMRDQVSEVLRGAGFVVTACANGEEGLAQALRETPDLVVSDVQMPILDGFVLCESIKGSASGSAVPVLLLTRLDDPTSVLRGLQVGADGFLLKSAGLKNLVPRVQRALDKAVDGGASDKVRRKKAVGKFSESVGLTEGRREVFSVLFESMTREAPFELLSLLILDGSPTIPLVTVSRAAPSTQLLKITLDQVTKTASMLADQKIQVAIGDIDVIALDPKLPKLQPPPGRVPDAIKVPLWDDGRFAGELGIFDLTGELQIEDNIRYFFDLGIELARALRKTAKAS